MLCCGLLRIEKSPESCSHAFDHFVILMNAENWTLIRVFRSVMCVMSALSFPVRVTLRCRCCMRLNPRRHWAMGMTSYIQSRLIRDMEEGRLCHWGGRGGAVGWPTFCPSLVFPRGVALGETIQLTRSAITKRRTLAITPTR